jgi:RNA polymerase sigma-70 factor (ECF subfamily)
MKPFKQIYREEIAYVWSCLRRLGVDEKNLEDKAHDVFVVFYKRRRDFDTARPVRPWLAGIAARVALDYNRLAYKKREVLSDHIAETMVVSNPEAVMEREDAKRRLLTALGTLDIDRRSVFVLHDIEGRSIPEIAETINVPINTLYSRLCLARQQLTALLTREPRRRCGT